MKISLSKNEQSLLDDIDSCGHGDIAKLFSKHGFDPTEALAGSDMTGIDFRGTDLRQLNVTAIDWSGAILTSDQKRYIAKANQGTGSTSELKPSQALSGVELIVPKRFGDSRGFFSESWNRRTMSEIGVDLEFVQDNHSLSVDAGTLRGLHFQSPPHAQAKLVRCGRGRLFDVAVDIRKGSPTFGRWYGEELSFENGKQLLIPVGFMHGFITLEPNTEIIYKCSDYYDPSCDSGVRWDDPTIGIDWGLGQDQPILSEKDAAAPFLSQIDSPFLYTE